MREGEVSLVLSFVETDEDLVEILSLSAPSSRGRISDPLLLLSG